MSDAQKIGTGLGFIVGGLLTGGAGFGLIAGLQGASLGFTIGTAFTKTELDPIEGNKLEDLSFTSSSYGNFINRVYGRDRIPGTVIWLKNNKIDQKEHRTSSRAGGKGTPKITNISYTYSATFAIGLCEGPITDVMRIWADTTLIYDATTRGKLESLEKGVDYLAEEPIVYKGVANESVDDTIDDNEDNPPAFRNLAYIVFKDLQLEEFGNRIPNITVEVRKNLIAPRVQAIAAGDDGLLYNSIDGTTWNPGTKFTTGDIVDLKQANGVWLACTKNEDKIYRSTNGEAWTLVHDKGVVTVFSNLLAYGGDGKWMMGGSTTGGNPYAVYSSNNGLTWTTVDVTTLTNKRIDAIASDGAGKFLVVVSGGSLAISTDGGAFGAVYANPSPKNNNYVLNYLNNNFYLSTGDASSKYISTSSTGLSGSWTVSGNFHNVGGLEGAVTALGYYKNNLYLFTGGSGFGLGGAFKANSTLTTITNVYNTGVGIGLDAQVLSTNGYAVFTEEDNSNQNQKIHIARQTDISWQLVVDAPIANTPLNAVAINESFGGAFELPDNPTESQTIKSLKVDTQSSDGVFEGENGAQNKTRFWYQEDGVVVLTNEKHVNGADRVRLKRHALTSLSSSIISKEIVGPANDYYPDNLPHNGQGNFYISPVIGSKDWVVLRYDPSGSSNHRTALVHVRTQAVFLIEELNGKTTGDLRAVKLGTKVLVFSTTKDANYYRAVFQLPSNVQALDFTQDEDDASELGLEGSMA